MWWLVLQQRMTDTTSIPSFRHNRYPVSAGKAGAWENAPCHWEIRGREWEGAFSLENAPGIGMLCVSYLFESSWKPCKTHACLAVPQMSKGWLSRTSHHLDDHKRPSVLATQTPVCTIASRSHPFSVAMSPEPRAQSLSFILYGGRDSPSLDPLSLFPRAARPQPLPQDLDASRRL